LLAMQALPAVAHAPVPQQAARVLSPYYSVMHVPCGYCCVVLDPCGYIFVEHDFCRSHLSPQAPFMRFTPASQVQRQIGYPLSSHSRRNAPIPKCGCKKNYYRRMARRRTHPLYRGVLTTTPLAKLQGRQKKKKKKKKALRESDEPMTSVDSHPDPCIASNLSCAG
jgi:hypothetical protein